MEENLTVEAKETTPEVKTENTIDISKFKEAIKKPATTPDEQITKLEAELLLAKKQRDEYSSKVAEFNRDAKAKATKDETEKDETARLLAEMTTELENARRETKFNSLSSRFAKVGITDDKVLDSFAKTLSYVPDEQSVTPQAQSVTPQAQSVTPQAQSVTPQTEKSIIAEI